MTGISRLLFSLFCVALLLLYGAAGGGDHGLVALVLSGITSATEPDFITATIQQFMKISGLGNTSIYKLLDAGEIESVNVGRRRLIVIASYRKYLERHSGKPATSPLAIPPVRRGRPPRQVEAASAK